MATKSQDRDGSAVCPGGLIRYLWQHQSGDLDLSLGKWRRVSGVVTEDILDFDGADWSIGPSVVSEL